MPAQRLVIGVYGIQDCNSSETPTISHDHGIAILQNGKVIESIQLERLNRKKQSADLNSMLFSLLKSKNLLTQTCNYVFVDNILGRSFINSEGNIRFEAPLQNSLQLGIEKGNLWMLDKNFTGYIVNHELAHIGSCLPFFGDFKDNSLLIHFDGGASKSNFSAWLYKNNKLVSVEYNWDLKWLSSLYNANALVFGMVNAKQHDLNSVPGKFMGFASFGTYSEKIEKWLIENDFFANCWKSKRFFFESVKTTFNISLKHLDQKDSFIQNVAATIQHVFIRESFNKISALQKSSKTKYLYYSGGSALNILLNNKIIESGIFVDVFIPPCCNDSGLALGAAAFFEWKHNNKIEINSPYLNNWGIEHYKSLYNKETIKETANILLAKKVIAVCNNQAEIGPRALGNRSILSLASDKKLAQKVSMQHKKREWYRPVAPIMLEKNTKYFTGQKTIHHLSKYMLLDFSILPEKQNELIGAVHIDGTSRIQTVFKREENPFIYDLLTYLDLNHNVKALINTSFNIKGEPIVHTIEDAFNSAKNMQLDAIVLNGKLEILNN